MMLLIIFYHLFLLLIYAVLVVSCLAGKPPAWLLEHQQPLFCMLAGGFGGSIYCLRAVYLNVCVYKQGNPIWRHWYYLRPIVSLCCGFVSFIFLKAGLLALDADLKQDSNFWGFYALAFIAGLNVDRFIEKIEGLAQATWGIERSRTANRTDIKKE